MANPRRTTFSSSNQLPISDPIPQFIQSSQNPQTLLSSLKIFLKKPHAFPFLLSIFLLLTWVSLRFQHHDSSSLRSHQSAYSAKEKSAGFVKDVDANAVKFDSFSSPLVKDKRGWMVDPVEATSKFGISGGAVYCASVHMGEIRPGGMRGNHRHQTCNETFVIWGAKTVFRLENNAVTRGYSELIVGADEVAVAASRSGTAHALMNIDTVRTTYFLGCQDSVINYTDSTTDFKVWKDL